MDLICRQDENDIVYIDNRSDEVLLRAFAGFLMIDVANGDARDDTLRVYQLQVKNWIEWCYANDVAPGSALPADVKAYRRFLTESGMKHSTISLKLTAIRRFYEAAAARGLIKANPAEGVKPPRERDASSVGIKYLSAGEAEVLFMTVCRDGSLKSLRDRAMLALMAIEGLRSVEIVRADESDIEIMAEGEIRILVHGKGRDGYIYPREDTLRVLNDYLVEKRETEKTDNSCSQGSSPTSGKKPLFVAVGNRAGGKRITRDGVRCVVNHYLDKASLKRPGISCHALRHTCGALLYQATRDVKIVQETLRHANISMAARYSHIIERRQARYTREIPVKV